jgi:hypothetical protein
MDKLKMTGVKSDPIDSLLRRFRWVVFSITDYRVANRGKLYSDLVLQTCHQINPHQRSIGKSSLYGIPKLGTSRPRIFRRAQLLMHSLASKMVHQRSRLNLETAAHYNQVLTNGSVVEKLPDERLPISIGLGKQQHSGGKPIDAMHDQGSLLVRLKARSQH